jgi:hypothetical protein
MRRAVNIHTARKRAEPVGESGSTSPKSHSGSSKSSDEKRKRARVLVVGLSILISAYCFSGYWKMDGAINTHVPPTHPVMMSSVNSTSTEKTISRKRSLPHCKVVSIYPPHLQQKHDGESNLCGYLFYPLDFAQRDVPSTYNWKRTGYEYYAAGIGLHHVTFDLSSSSSSRHNLLYNSMMKCGSTSVNRALKELKKAAEENFPDTPMAVVYQGKQNNLLATESGRIMSDLYQYQQYSQEGTMSNPSKMNGTFHYFTTVRDPVSRFVSAIAQEMYVRRNDPKAQSFREKCLLETPQKTLGCSIQHVQDRFEGKEELDQPHFIPMTTILYRRSYGFNASVVLFPTDQVSRIVSKMVAPSRLASFETKKNPLKAQGSLVLKNMTVADLTSDMTARICELYAMDVRMMTQAGFPSLCS